MTISDGNDSKSSSWNRFSDPVSDRVSEILRETGVGNRLPSERELSEQLGVSRTGLRDRLRLLESVGVIRRQQGSGTYVAPLDPSGLAFALNVMLASSHLALNDLLSVRIALERQAAIEAAQRPDPVLMGHLKAQLNILEASGDDAEIEEADWRFHEVMLKASGNPALAFVTDALAGVLRRALRQRQEEWRRTHIHRSVLLEVHKAVYDALVAEDPEAAAAAVDGHFVAFTNLVEAHH